MSEQIRQDLIQEGVRNLHREADLFVNRSQAARRQARARTQTDIKKTKTALEKQWEEEDKKDRETYKRRREAALADASDLTPEERSARNGLANRQVTLR